MTTEPFTEITHESPCDEPPEGEYHFTQDWFSWAPDLLNQIIPQLPSRQNILEIGSFEGRSTVWLVEHMLEDGGTITCVDTWEGSEEHGFSVTEKAEELFERNAQLCRDRFKSRGVRKIKDSSQRYLSFLGPHSGHEQFDFIYVDGSHTAPDVLTDAILAWPLLRQGGVIVFDDYLWGESRDILHRPKIGVDAFVNVFAEQIEIVSIGYQLAVKKR